MSIKGSKITDSGKATTACSQHRMVAVVPANNLAFTPLRMKLAITSDYDKQSPDLEAQGWQAFSNYTASLRGKGVQHTAALVTKMRFDPGAAYPKVLFSPDRWLTEPELAQVASLVRSDSVKALVEPHHRGGAPVVTNATTAPETAAPAAPAAPTAPSKPTAKPAATKSAAKVTPVEGKIAKAVAIPVDDAPVESEGSPVSTISDDVMGLLAEWGEDE